MLQEKIMRGEGADPDALRREEMEKVMARVTPKETVPTGGEGR